MYLYKILSKENWEKSKGKEALHLPQEDEEFIHLSTEDQLKKIIEKYWKKVPEFFILKIDAEKLPGDLRFEANPGGTNKYYHLYNGYIPHRAIVASRTSGSNEPIK